MCPLVRLGVHKRVKQTYREKPVLLAILAHLLFSDRWRRLLVARRCWNVAGTIVLRSQGDGGCRCARWAGQVCVRHGVKVRYRVGRVQPRQSAPNDDKPKCLRQTWDFGVYIYCAILARLSPSLSDFKFVQLFDTRPHRFIAAAVEVVADRSYATSAQLELRPQFIPLLS